MVAPGASTGAYLSARQAARRLNVSDKTVRAWVRTGRLPAAPSAQGFRIPADAVDALAAERGADTGADRFDHAADAAPLRDQVADLRTHVADLRTQLEVKDRQISELHTLLAQAQRALPSPDALRRDSDGVPVETVPAVVRAPTALVALLVGGISCRISPHSSGRSAEPSLPWLGSS